MRDSDAESNCETPQTDHHSDDDAAICQTPLEEPMSTPCDLGVSPLRAKLLDFASPSQDMNRPPHLNEDVADEERDDDNHDDQDDENQDDKEDHEDVDHWQLDVVWSPAILTATTTNLHSVFHVIPIDPLLPMPFRVEP